MNRRWMKAVVETSRQAMPALPFQRGQRGGARQIAGRKAASAA